MNNYFCVLLSLQKSHVTVTFPVGRWIPVTSSSTFAQCHKKAAEKKKEILCPEAEEETFILTPSVRRKYDTDLGGK